MYLHTISFNFNIACHEKYRKKACSALTKGWQLCYLFMQEIGPFSINFVWSQILVFNIHCNLLWFTELLIIYLWEKSQNIGICREKFTKKTADLTEILGANFTQKSKQESKGGHLSASLNLIFIICKVCELQHAACSKP